MRAAILSCQSSRERIDQLFRTVQGKPLNRVTVGTVTMQADPAKRVREARRRLKTEGITVLGHNQDDLALARENGLPLPRRGEWLSMPPSTAFGGSSPPDPTEV